jgi:hypothetical protein
MASPAGSDAARWPPGRHTMHQCLLGLAFVSMASGCKTHQVLAENFVRTTATVTDLNYRLVLTNVALFTGDPNTIPSFAVLNAGTVTVTDSKTLNVSGAAAPTIAFAQQAGGTPFLLLAGGPTVERDLTENWSMVPITEPETLHRLRCAFQFLIAAPRGPACESCEKRLTAVFLDNPDPLDILIPRGWYHAGSKKDVPKTARYVGCYGDTYVWVTAEGMEGLARFTLTVLDLASGRQRWPTKSVQKTYKPDGTLESIQETSTQIDREALEKLRQEGGFLTGATTESQGTGLNRGLFFLRSPAPALSGYSANLNQRYISPTQLLQ